MPDNVIDKLQIEIESNSKTAATSLSQFQNALKKLDALGKDTGIQNLYKSLKKLETINLSKLSKQLSTIFEAAKKPIEIKTKIVSGNAPKAKTITDTSGKVDTTTISRTADVITDSTEKIESVAAVAARSFDSLTDPIERVRAEIENYSQRIKLLTDDYNKLNASGKGDPLSLLSLEKQIISASGTLDSLQNKFNALNTPPIPEIVKYGQELEQLEKHSKKAVSGLGKIVDSFKRIAMYRIIRSILKEISQAFIQGMQNYVQYSKEADTTMSNLMNTGNQLKNTLGVTFISLLSAVEPLITILADGIIDIANGINALMASMRGEDTFVKAKKGADSYADSLKNVKSQLFSFDKFESLAANNQANLFEVGDVSSEMGSLNVDAENIKKAFTGIEDLFKSIGGLIDSIMPSILSIASAAIPAIAGIARAFTPAIKGILDFVGGIIQFLDKTGLLVPALATIAGTLLTLKFLKARDEALQFNIAIDDQKLKLTNASEALTLHNQKVQDEVAVHYHLSQALGACDVDMQQLTRDIQRKYQAEEQAIQRVLAHEKAMLKQMQTTRVLNTAMGALQAVMGATALGATIGDLIKNWGEMSTAQKISQISTIALTAAMTALAIANVAAQSGLGAMVAVPLAVVTIGAGIASAVAAAKSSVPKLADGAVIPPNNEFLAVLGDQKSGTNIETPLATMKQAFRDSIMEMGGSVENNGVGENPSFNLTIVYQDENGRERARRDIPNMVAEINRAGGLRKAGFKA